MGFTLTRKQIEGVLRGSDEKLWQTVCMLDLSKKRPDQRRIAGIRTLLSALTEEDLCRINELLDCYRDGTGAKTRRY